MTEKNAKILSVEQMKELMKFNCDLAYASMCYGIDVDGQYNLLPIETENYRDVISKNPHRFMLIYTLDDMLDMLPKSIRDNSTIYTLNISYTVGDVCKISYIDEDYVTRFTTDFGNIIDCLYETTKWYLSNKGTITKTEYFDFSNAIKKIYNGYHVALPEWKGYWYLGNDDTIMVHTKEGEELDTPWYSLYCERKDWIIVK